MPTLTKEQILERLRAHRPLDEGDASRGIAVRWLATAAMAMLAPLGVFLLRSVHPFVDGHALFLAVSLTALGLLGAFIGYMAATRRAAAERQWGMAKLTKEECIELEDVSSQVPQISQVVDHWLEVWVSAGQSPRGRELVLVREMVAAWKALEGVGCAVQPRNRQSSHQESGRPRSTT